VSETDGVGIPLSCARLFLVVPDRRGVVLTDHELAHALTGHDEHIVGNRNGWSRLRNLLTM
jgi:hypothetical protein